MRRETGFPQRRTGISRSNPGLRINEGLDPLWFQHLAQSLSLSFGSFRRIHARRTKHPHSGTVPLIYLITHEEERAERAIAEVAQIKPVKRLFTWTVTRGISEYGQGTYQQGTMAAEAALREVMRSDPKEPAIYIFKDLHPFLTHDVTIRCIRDAVATFKNTQKTIIILSPVQVVPVELEKEIVVIDFNLPTPKEIEEVLSQQIGQVRIRKMPQETKEKLVRAALGLTRDEAEKVYRKAQVTTGRLTEEEVEIVLSEKKQIIKRNGILEYLEEDESLATVGGLEELKRWLKQRSNAFSQRAREYGLPQPKGLLILGVPGCGKSLIAKTTAKLWSLPLVRLDIGRVYDGTTVGRSEANLRNALKVAESISPVILFIDEIDKAFAGSTGSADSDGGTSSRIFGTFLTWMQEKKSPVFVMATANRVDRLPGNSCARAGLTNCFLWTYPPTKSAWKFSKFTSANGALTSPDLTLLS